MNKPENVTDHEHFIYSEEDDRLRFDACALADGSFVVWDVWRDVLYRDFSDFQHACDWAAMCSAKERRATAAESTEPNGP